MILLLGDASHFVIYWR